MMQCVSRCQCREDEIPLSNMLRLLEVSDAIFLPIVEDSSEDQIESVKRSRLK
jgi:hypothetical protein